MADSGQPVKKDSCLGNTARTSLLWGGGFTLARDFVQFATMLVLVRILSPEDYGSAALGQSILGLISVVSFGTFVLHTLQQRDPANIDWQAHFTAAVFINSLLFSLTLLVAWGLSFHGSYQNSALPLAGLAVVFLIEAPGSLRHRMLETQHDWKRFRLLLIIGTLLSSFVGLIVALLGGGVWALIVQVPLLGLPAAIDLFWGGHWRPNWSWSWKKYRDIASFGANRMGAALVLKGRQAAEQTILAGTYDLGALGVFTRTVGLANLIAGRIGSVAMMSLYPIVTRAEKGSERFQRISALVLQGVCWSTVPFATFLAVCASDVVELLYGENWRMVAALLPLAVAGVALSGIATTATSLLLANNDIRLSLAIDSAAACAAVALAFWLVPAGVDTYLAGLAILGVIMVVLSLFALVIRCGIKREAILSCIIPSLLGSAGAALVLEGFCRFGIANFFLPTRLLLGATIFFITYLLILRIVFPSSMRDLLEVAPAGKLMTKYIFL